MSDDKKEPEELDNITLKVLGLLGHDDQCTIQIKIKKDAPMIKLMNAYCNRYKLDIRDVRFRFDGEPLLPLSTPSTLGMVEGNTVEAFKAQCAGPRLEPEFITLV